MLVEVKQGEGHAYVGLWLIPSTWDCLLMGHMMQSVSCCVLGRCLEQRPHGTHIPWESLVLGLATPLPVPLPAQAHPGRQRRMTQGLEFLPPTWETHLEFWALGLALALAVVCVCAVSQWKEVSLSEFALKAEAGPGSMA